ncbi:MAG TPA: OmpA family protein [Candidatus Acidoferrales bacterium]|nr:OmpA family protein [Candidatus Acidoferrales bacterium]
MIGIVLCATSGCSLWKPSVPAPTKEQIVLHGIVDFDKSNIRSDSVALIEEAAAKLKEDGNLGVVVEGHSDSKGSPKYNQKLSLRRAEAVRDYLVRLGVDRGRIVVIGKGSGDPVATSATPEGRMQNRRVVLIVYKQ